MVLEHHIAHAEGDPFGDAESRTIRQLEHRSVSKRQRLVERGCSKQLVDFVDAENFRQSPPFFRGLETLARIPHDMALSHQKLEIGANG